jgi:hypothetical protein
MPQSNTDPSTNWTMAYTNENNIEAGVCENGTKNVKIVMRMIATPATLNELLTNQKQNNEGLLTT